MSSEQATIAVSEDMDWGYVLVDEHAPTVAAARKALIEQAPIEWGWVIPTDVPTGRRRWFRFDENQEELVPCDAGDPERDSEWWGFDISLAEEAGL